MRLYPRTGSSGSAIALGSFASTDFTITQDQPRSIKSLCISPTREDTCQTPRMPFAVVGQIQTPAIQPSFTPRLGQMSSSLVRNQAYTPRNPAARGMMYGSIGAASSSARSTFTPHVRSSGSRVFAPSYQGTSSSYTNNRLSVAGTTNTSCSRRTAVRYQSRTFTWNKTTSKPVTPNTTATTLNDEVTASDSSSQAGRMTPLHTGHGDTRATTVPHTSRQSSVSRPVARAEAAETSNQATAGSGAPQTNSNIPVYPLQGEGT